MPAAQLKRVAREQLKRVDDVYRSTTASLRALPDFLIIGEAKCGTTSLYDDLVSHPSVLEASIKEVHFFDLRYHRGLDWYKAQFPLAWRMRKTPGDRVQTGEASPYYLFHPHAPARIKQALPGVKLIAMLRNPVERAYSHYQHEFRKQRETLSFEEAVDREPERLRGELERMLENPRYNSREHRRHAYVTRGIYVDSLQHVKQLFGDRQLLVIKSEDYFTAPDAMLTAGSRFLELPPRAPRVFARKNVGSYAPIDAGLRGRLVDLLRAPQLAALPVPRCRFRVEVTVQDKAGVATVTVPTGETEGRRRKAKRSDRDGKKSYGRTAKVGAVWSMMRQGVNEGIGLPVSMVMARLLSPHDFGVAAASGFFIQLAAG